MISPSEIIVYLITYQILSIMLKMKPWPSAQSLDGIQRWALVKYTNAYMDGFDRSVSKIVEALITTYPINLATFPRTPPMKIRGKDMSLLRGSEEIEDDPLGAEAVESTITEGGTMEPTTGYE